MKTVLVRIEGDPHPGDVLILSHSHPVRGGVSSARVDVRQDIDSIQVINGSKQVITSAMTQGQVLDAMVHEANKWDGFRAQRRNDRELVVMCSDAVDQVQFHGSCSGGQTIEIEDLG